MTPKRVDTIPAAAIAVFALLAGSALAQAIPIEVGTWMIRGNAGAEPVGRGASN